MLLLVFHVKYLIRSQGECPCSERFGGKFIRPNGIDRSAATHTCKYVPFILFVRIMFLALQRKKAVASLGNGPPG